MNKFSKNEIIITAIALIVIVAVTATLGALKIAGVLNIGVDAFLLMLTTMTLGIGLYATVFGIVRKGGYELAVGLILLTVGVVCLLIALNVYFVIIIIVAIAMILITVLSLILLKASSLVVERTNERADFVPYMEKLANEKQAEKEAEKELPEIKSFKE